METNTIKTEKSILRVQTGIVLLVATVLVLTMTLSQKVYSGNQLSLDKQTEASFKPDKGAYLATVFNEFKKEKLKTGIYTKQQVSEKVLLKLFIKYMKEQDSRNAIK